MVLANAWAGVQGPSLHCISSFRTLLSLFLDQMHQNHFWASNCMGSIGKIAKLWQYFPIASDVVSAQGFQCTGVWHCKQTLGGRRGMPTQNPLPQLEMNWCHKGSWSIEALTHTPNVSAQYHPPEFCASHLAGIPLLNEIVPDQVKWLLYNSKISTDCNLQHSICGRGQAPSYACNLHKFSSEPSQPTSTAVLLI